MRRLMVVLSLVVLAWLLAAPAAYAQGGTWPEYPLQNGWTGPGWYLSLVKVFLPWLVMLMWIYTTDWVNRDCMETEMPYVQWNPIVFGPFVGAFVLMWLLPWFWLGFPLLVIAYAAPLTFYVIQRNQTVEPHERVMTRDHLRHWFAERAWLIGMKVEVEKKDERDAGPPVTLSAKGGPSERDERARLLSARQMPGLRDVRQILADGMSRRTDGIMLDYTQESVAVRWLIDGVWHNAQPMERETGDPALETLKVLCGGNPQDRQNRQQGKFAADYQGEHFDVDFASQGTQTGERVLLQLEGKKARFDTLDEIGMRPKMQEHLQVVLGLRKGLLLFSAMPGAGLRTSMTVILHSTDRFTREFAAVEHEDKPYEVVENVPVHVYGPKEGKKAEDVLNDVFLMEPNVVVCRDLADAKMVGQLCEEIKNERLIISTMRAKDSAEALLRVLSLKVPPAQFAGAVAAVMSQRLIRKLCEHCKEGYTPQPQVLQQMGIPPGRVQVLYRPPQQRGEDEEICAECNGIGYVGRTAIFELLTVGDNVRQVLAKSPKLDLLRQAARKDGMKSLQEEGVVLVAKGVTSLQELMRVLKQ